MCFLTPFFELDRLTPTDFSSTPPSPSSPQFPYPDVSTRFYSSIDCTGSIAVDIQALVNSRCNFNHLRVKLRQKLSFIHHSNTQFLGFG
jgi:hypothetical protein